MSFGFANQRPGLPVKLLIGLIVRKKVMQSRLSIFVIVSLALLSCVVAAPPPELWKIAPGAPDALTARLALVDRESAPLPSVLRPAADFQKILLRVMAGEPVSNWRPDVDRFAHATGDEPITRALKELALCWEARARMEEIDGALRKYYRSAVRFPDKLDEAKGDIPTGAKTDPWGENWIYKPAAPHGFADLARQRYQLTPSRYPKFSTLREFIHKTFPPVTWKIAVRNAAGAKALEIKTPDGQIAAVQAGGKVADATVAYIGDGWALFADTERLFVIPF